MKVLVTGSTGFIGKFTVPQLLAKGHEVIAVTRETDLKNPNECNALINKTRPELLLHLAWETTHGKFWNEYSNIEWLKGSLALLESFAKNKGKRVVIAGTCAEIEPVNLYGACKESLRLIAQPLLASYGVSLAWGRIFYPYGPFEKAGRLIPSLISTLIDKKPFSCSSKNAVYDFLYVEDVAAAFLTLLENDLQGTVDIGTGDGIAIGDVVEQIARKMDAANLINWGIAETPKKIIANPKLLKECGWKPNYSLETGIEKTIQWWNDALHN